MTQWKFVKVVAGGERWPLDGINIWDHRWKTIKNEIAIIKDPHYGQEYRFEVYQVLGQTATHVFAAGEFSNGIWGFYFPEDDRPDAAGGTG